MKELGYERALRDWMQQRGMRHERLAYARPEAGGETVAYRLAPERAPDGLLLVAHGAGNDALFAFAGLFKQVLLRGWEIFSFDLDGHGRSSTTTFGFPAIGSAVAAALEQARAGRSELPVHAYGVSLGGTILLHALTRRAAGIRSAVVVCAPLRIRFSVGRVLGELRPRLWRTLMDQREHAGIWGMVPSFGPVKRGAYPLRLAESRRSAFGYVDVLNDVLDRLGVIDSAHRIDLPALLAYGTADRIVPPEQGLVLRRALPRSELMLVRGGTHLTTPFDRLVLRRTLDSLTAAPPHRARSRGTGET